MQTAVELKCGRRGYGRKKLLSPIEDQLFSKYLEPEQASFGIYVVLWFKTTDYDYPKAWEKSEDLEAEVRRECERVSKEHGVALAAYVLDVTARFREH